MNTPQLFLSYSHSETDREWVRQFAQSLERRGFSVWFDETRLHFGDRIQEAVEQGLRDSDIIISLVTPHNVNRPSLLFELGAALGMGKRVIAIVPKDLDPSLLPQPLRARRFLQQASPEETASALAAETTSLEVGERNDN